MASSRVRCGCGIVALLAEGVDRNHTFLALSSRRMLVALLAEGVDRNTLNSTNAKAVVGRPPRGGRG